MEDLIGKVINQIQKDLDWSETEGLELLLKEIPKDKLKGFLSEYELSLTDQEKDL